MMFFYVHDWSSLFSSQRLDSHSSGAAASKGRELSTSDHMTAFTSDSCYQLNDPEMWDNIEEKAARRKR